MFTNIQSPPPCSCCGAKSLEDHKPDCNHLAALKAQAYPEVLDLNGRPWRDNMIDKQNERIKELRALAGRLRDALRNAEPFIGYHMHVPEVSAQATALISEADKVLGG